MPVRALAVVAAAAAIAVVALSACASASPRASVSRAVPHGFYGVTWNAEAALQTPAAAARDWDRMALNGVESVRVDFNWAAAQPDRGGAIDFTATDRAVRFAAERRIALLPIVLTAPVWARAFPAVHQSPPRRPSDYAAYAAALARRYGSRGTFWRENRDVPRRPLRDIQVWNEPALTHHWYRPPGDRTWEDEYGALLRATRAAVRRADPRMRIVLGGMPNYSWRDLRSLYRRGNVRGQFDVMAVHPYTGRPEGVVRLAELVRGVLRANGDGDVPIWFTEMSWPASVGRMRPPSGLRSLATTERGSASRLTRAYALLAGPRGKRLGVGRVYWYNWASNYAARDFFDFAGLYRFSRGRFTPTPKLAAYRASARRHEGCAKTATGACR